MSYRPQLGAEPAQPPVFPLKVFVLAEDMLAADGLRAALREDARLRCVERAAEAEIVVWDLGTGPSQSALEAPRLTSAGYDATHHRLLVLVADESAAASALALGALGVLRRRAHAPTLAAAVIAVRLGLCVLDGKLADQFVTLPQDAGPTPASGQPGLDALTQREHEVLEALALGLSNRLIAERLGVSVHTVKFHVNGILAKLEVDSRAGAVAKALRNGLVRS